MPVHTLAGRPLPAPTTDAVEAGAPVRLRPINTDSTTHRCTLAGTAFRVVAMDGTDPHKPMSLMDIAVLIPAGGRYDLAFTAPATRVALFVDGRPVFYSTAVCTHPATSGR